VYVIIFGFGTYYLVRLVQRGLPEHAPTLTPERRPARPLSAATEAE
jgi:hypothetical protein